MNGKKQSGVQHRRAFQALGPNWVRILALPHVICIVWVSYITSLCIVWVSCISPQFWHSVVVTESMQRLLCNFSVLNHENHCCCYWWEEPGWMGMVIPSCLTLPESTGESADTSRDQSMSQNKDSCHQRSQRCNLDPGPTLTFSLHPSSPRPGESCAHWSLIHLYSSLLLLFYRKKCLPDPRRLMNSRELKFTTPKSMTLKQL